MKNVQKSIQKFRKFNRTEPKKIVRFDVDLETPLVRIGPVPVIVYVSKKEGRERTYKHFTRKPYPVMYGHPDGKYFVIIGGNVKISDWLRG